MRGASFQLDRPNNKMDTDSSSHRGFVPRGLPWLIAGVAVLAYLLTLGRFVNYRGIEALAQAAGWDWRPVYVKPLHFLLTYPICWLPGAWQVAGLNLFAAISASSNAAIAPCSRSGPPGCRRCWPRWCAGCN